MQSQVLGKFVFHPGTMCTIVECLDVCLKNQIKIFSRRKKNCFFFVYFKCDCISISRKTCFSTRPPASSDLNITFIATINFVFFSLARYTRPNLPRPNDAPSSKSSLLHSYLQRYELLLLHSIVNSLGDKMKFFVCALNARIDRGNGSLR